MAIFGGIQISKILKNWRAFHRIAFHRDSYDVECHSVIEEFEPIINGLGFGPYKAFSFIVVVNYHSPNCGVITFDLMIFDKENLQEGPVFPDFQFGNILFDYSDYMEAYQ